MRKAILLLLLAVSLVIAFPLHAYEENPDGINPKAISILKYAGRAYPSMCNKCHIQTKGDRPTDYVYITYPNGDKFRIHLGLLERIVLELDNEMGYTEKINSQGKSIRLQKVIMRDILTRVQNHILSVQLGMNK